MRGSDGRAASAVRRFARTAIVLAMLAVAFLLCIDLLYFAHGSLEEFPTDEDTSAVRLVTAVVAVILLLVEVWLWLLLRYLGRQVSVRERADGSARRSLDS